MSIFLSLNFAWNRGSSCRREKLENHLVRVSFLIIEQNWLHHLEFTTAIEHLNGNFSRTGARSRCTTTAHQHQSYNKETCQSLNQVSRQHPCQVHTVPPRRYR